MENQRAIKITKYHHKIVGGIRLTPISIQAALTDSCFNRCIGCGHPNRDQKKMDVGKWLGFLESLPNKPESICYSGGDPMAYPDFNKVMEWHIDNDVAFGCTITGYVPTSIDIKLLKMAEWIRVSLDSINPEVYAKIRGKTPLSKVLHCIDDMLEAGVNVQLGITISDYNKDELPKIIKWANAKGITNVDSRYMYPDSMQDTNHKDKTERDVLPFKHCSAVFYQLYVDSDGTVYPCCVTAGDTRSSPQTIGLGNIFENTWLQIWDKVTKYSEREFCDLPKICQTCCVKRLSEINNVCDSIANEKSFF
jgi:radical SAM protein with 4Fe4S-binding SPASM domain